jgi:hypothetical protein
MDSLKAMAAQAVEIKAKPGLTRLGAVKPLEQEHKEQIVVGLPPNFQKILAVFPKANGPGVIFAYGDTIYNPSGGELPMPIVAHELVHLDQQKVAGGTEIWWDKYLVDRGFRFAEELQAHQVEYYWACSGINVDRNLRRRYLGLIAGRLSGPLYGYMTTLEKAKSLIKGRPT